MKILIVDDNQSINQSLSKYLANNGFETLSAFDGEEALDIFYSQSPDLILLDVMMPKKDGFEVCRELRKTSMIPVIMLTARGEDFERVMGLEIGADDYIVKPFSMEEVVARVNALFRRITPYENHSYIFKIDNLTINSETYRVTIDDVNISLTKKEFEILWTLATNRNKVFTRDNLLDSVWGLDYYGDTRTVDTHIRRLRSKIDEIEHPKWSISTIRGVGYQFEVLS